MLVPSFRGPAPERVATSARESGTVDWRAIAALAAHFGNGGALPEDTPLAVSGASAQGFGAGGPALAMAALIHAAGDRRDVLLRVSDTGSGVVLLVTAARRLGWARPEISPAAITATHPVSHRGVALFRAAGGNAAVLDQAAAMARARIPVACWCDECGPVPLTGPCGEHSLPGLRAAWQAKTWGAAAARRINARRERETI